MAETIYENPGPESVSANTTDNNQIISQSLNQNPNTNNVEYEYKLFLFN